MPTKTSCEPYNKSIFVKNLLRYMQINHLKKIDIAKAAGVSSGTFSDWISERSFPRTAK